MDRDKSKFSHMKLFSFQSPEMPVLFSPLQLQLSEQTCSRAVGDDQRTLGNKFKSLFFNSTPKSGITGSCDKFIFPLVMNKGSKFSMSLPTLVICRFFHF